MGKIFITGASGQIGSNLVEYLISSNALNIQSPKDIVCLVRKPRKARVLINFGVTIVQGDITNKIILQQIFNEHSIEYVFHLAANISPDASMIDYFKPNIIGTRNMLDFFVRSSAKYFIYTSSISVYEGYLGKNKQHCEFDEHSPLSGTKNNDSYSLSKRLSELMILQLKQKYPSKKFIITRPGIVMGSYDKLTLPAFINLSLMKYIPKLIDYGRDLISFVSPQEAAQALVFLIKQEDHATNEIYNITAQPVSYKELLTWISEYYKIKPPSSSIPYWFFKFIKPLLKIIKILFKKNKTIQTYFSSTALNFIGKSLIFKSDKLKNLGFKFPLSNREAIMLGLTSIDPKKTRLRQ